MAEDWPGDSGLVLLVISSPPSVLYGLYHLDTLLSLSTSVCVCVCVCVCVRARARVEGGVGNVRGEVRERVI